MSVVLLCLLSVGISFLVTFVAVPICSFLAWHLHFVDKPDGKVKQHAQVVPYLGGVAVYVGCMLPIIFMVPIDLSFLLFLSGATLFLLIGLIDDLFVLIPLQKIVGQIMSAFLFYKSDFYKNNFLGDGYISFIIAFFWILSISQAFNLIDIMDGLATTVAIGCAVTFLFFALSFNASIAIVLLSSMLGALIAFLWYNRPPAKIYLGDAGALFIGGTLAAAPFFIPWGSANCYGYIASIIIFAIPLLELTSLIIIRTYRGIPFYKPSPDHFAIYLMKNGWSKKKILVYISFLSLILAVSAIQLVFNYCCFLITVLEGVIFLVAWISVVGGFLK